MNEIITKKFNVTIESDKKAKYTIDICSNSNLFL